jgi:hypothetical protein
MTAFIARAFETVSLFLFSLPDIVVGLGSFCVCVSQFTLNYKQQLGFCVKMVCYRPEGGQSRIPACETFCLGEDEIKLPCVRKRRFLAGLNAIKTFFGGGSTLIGCFFPFL